jgi:hypothetical protein
VLVPKLSESSTDSHVSVPFAIRTFNIKSLLVDKFNIIETLHVNRFQMAALCSLDIPEEHGSGEVLDECNLDTQIEPSRLIICYNEG